MNAPKTERNPNTGRIQRVSPAMLGRQCSQRQAGAQARYLAGRRRDAKRNGYSGPLTRAEAASAGVLSPAMMRNR